MGEGGGGGGGGQHSLLVNVVFPLIAETSGLVSGATEGIVVLPHTQKSAPRGGGRGDGCFWCFSPITRLGTIVH